MVHSSDKRTQVAEHSFNLRGESKLELLVNVHAVFHLPPLLNVPIDAATIRLQSGLGLNMLEEKLAGIPFIHRGFGKHAVCHVS